jgi:hypothetical protein
VTVIGVDRWITAPFWAMNAVGIASFTPFGVLRWAQKLPFAFAGRFAPRAEKRL